MYSNERTIRANYHRQLVVQQDKPCEICSGRQDREIHRIIPRHKGGEYTTGNVQVLCRPCHLHLHPNSKFWAGDIIMLNGRTPAYIDLPRHRPRTILSIRYDTRKQCNFYLVGSNCRGVNTGNGHPTEGYSDYWFRSYQMLPYQPRRYHFKRQYNRHNLDTISSNTQQGGQRQEDIPECLDQPKDSLELSSRYKE